VSPSIFHPLRRTLIYAALIALALFFLMPVYLLLITGLKSFAEVDLQRMWDLPESIRFENFRAAYVALAPHLGRPARLLNRSPESCGKWVMTTSELWKC
jgi:ABC-type glycerol-3-phosphate transport system permease component